LLAFIAAPCPPRRVSCGLACLKARRRARGMSKAARGACIHTRIDWRRLGGRRRPPAPVKQPCTAWAQRVGAEGRGQRQVSMTGFAHSGRRRARRFLRAQVVALPLPWPTFLNGTDHRAPPIACRDHRRSSVLRRVSSSRRRSGGRHRCSAAPLFAEVACGDVGHRRLPAANVRPSRVFAAQHPMAGVMLAGVRCAARRRRLFLPLSTPSGPTEVGKLPPAA
jgi:hypothetical protein